MTAQPVTDSKPRITHLPQSLQGWQRPPIKCVGRNCGREIGSGELLVRRGPKMFCESCGGRYGCKLLTCECCGGEYLTDTHLWQHSRYCSHPCKARANRPEADPHRTCERCDAAFTGRADARYCSTRCRVAAHRSKAVTS